MHRRKVRKFFLPHAGTDNKREQAGLHSCDRAQKKPEVILGLFEFQFLKDYEDGFAATGGGIRVSMLASAFFAIISVMR